MIFPSELVTPYELDYSNPLAAHLLAAGVGVFISDDNLTTVTNVIDGTAGTSTDITSNERGAAIVGYRIGYDYSALSTEEQAILDADPYQVFKTHEDEVTQRGLLGVNQGQTVYFHMSGPYQLTIHFKDGTTETVTGSNTHQYDCRYDPYFLYAEGYDAGGNLFYDFNQAETLGYIPELIQGSHGGYDFNTFEGVVSPLEALPDDFGVYFNDYYYGNGGSQFYYDANEGTVFEWDLKPDKFNSNPFLGRNSNWGYLFFDNGGIAVRRSDQNVVSQTTSLYTVGERFTLAIVFGSGEFHIYKNGSFVETMPAGIQTDYSGLGDRNTSFIGHIYSFKIYEGGYGGELQRNWDFRNAYGFRIPCTETITRFNLNTALPTPVVRQPLFNEPRAFQFANVCTAEFATKIDLTQNLECSVTFTMYLQRGWDSIQLGGANSNVGVHIDPTRWYFKLAYSGSKVKKSHGFTFPENQRVVIEIRRDAAGLVELVVDDVVVDSATLTDAGTSQLAHIGKCDYDGNSFTSNRSVLYERVDIQGPGVHHSYDMVTGESGKIIDTVGANHATITDPRGYGFFRIIPERVFITNQDGVDADYALTTSNIQSMVSSANGADERMVIQIIDDVTTDQDLRVGYLGEATHQPIVDGLTPFNGDLKDTANNRTVTFTNGSKWYDYQPLFFRNMLTNGSDISVGSGGVLENVGLDNASLEIGGTPENPATVKNCVIQGLGSKARTSDNRRSITFIDSILTSRAVVRSFNTLNFINSISTNGDFSLDYSDNEILIQNSRIADQLRPAMTDLGGNQFSVDFTDVFEDSANGNYKIKQNWADANLVGQGYNNSDIAGWAYVSDSQTTPEETNYSVTLGKGMTGLSGKRLIVTFDRHANLSGGIVTANGERVSGTRELAATMSKGTFSATGKKLNITREFVAAFLSGKVSVKGERLQATHDRHADLLNGKVSNEGMGVSGLYNRFASFEKGAASVSGADTNGVYDRVGRLSKGTTSVQGAYVQGAYDRVASLHKGVCTLNGVDINVAISRLGEYTAQLAKGTASATGRRLSALYDRVGHLSSFNMDAQGGTMSVTVDRHAQLASGFVESSGNAIRSLFDRHATLAHGSIEATGDSLSFFYHRSATLARGTVGFAGQPISLTKAGEIILKKQGRIDGYTVKFDRSPVSITFEKY